MPILREVQLATSSPIDVGGLLQGLALEGACCLIESGLVNLVSAANGYFRADIMTPIVVLTFLGQLLAAESFQEGRKGAKPHVVVSGLPGAVVWDLKRLDRDPVKLIKASYDPKTEQAAFILELRRDLTPADLLEWQAPLAPIVFRFQDEDGTALVSLMPRYGSQLVPTQGRRFRVLLPMPKKTDGLKKIVVD